MKSIFIVALLLALANPLFSQTVKSNSVKKANTTKSSKVKSNFQLLQGKWRSMSDKTNYLVFYNHYRKELSGRKILDENKFIITDKCPEDNSNPPSNLNGKFIYQDGVCWSIIKLNRKHLILSPLNKGNTLNYVRIK